MGRGGNCEGNGSKRKTKYTRQKACYLQVGRSRVTIGEELGERKNGLTIPKSSRLHPRLPTEKRGKARTSTACGGSYRLAVPKRSEGGSPLIQRRRREKEPETNQPTFSSRHSLQGRGWSRLRGRARGRRCQTTSLDHNRNTAAKREPKKEAAHGEDEDSPKKNKRADRITPSERFRKTEKLPLELSAKKKKKI